MTKLLVCDLDNTLYDWVGYFVPAFYAMVDEVVALTGCDREQLLDEFRSVHQEHHDSEHPFSVLETDTIKRLFPGQSNRDVVSELDSAFHAFNRVRRETLTLYPGVRETLDSLRQEGVRLVAHTEAKLFAVVDRLTRLDLTDYFEHIYCRERSTSLHPDPAAAKAVLDHFPLDKVVELSLHQRKPDPRVLLEICARNAVTPLETAYVGDSISRDVLMARRGSVLAVWAKYGTRHRVGSYEKLVRITHWTSDDVARESELRTQAAGVQPDAVLETGFSEVLNVLGYAHSPS